MHLRPQQRVQLLGSEGHIDLVHAWNPPPDRPSELVLETSARLEATAAERIDFPPVNQYAILGPAVRARGGDPRPGADPLEESIKNMTVLDALRRSAASGRWETV